MPPYQDPYPGPYVQDRQYPTPQPGPPFSAMTQHVYQPHYDGRRHSPYAGPPPPQSFPPRDEPVRMSPVPVDVPPPPPPQATGSPYLSESSRDRYPPEAYYPVGPHHNQMRSYARVSGALLLHFI